MIEPVPTGVNGDPAGGAVASVSQFWGYLNDLQVLVVPDPVAAHGDAPHAGNLMATGSPWFTINDLPVCRFGDLADCGHPLEASQVWFLIS